MQWWKYANKSEYRSKVSNLSNIFGSNAICPNLSSSSWLFHFGGGGGVRCKQDGLVLQKRDWSLLLLSSSTPPKAGAPSAVCVSCCRSQQLPGQKSKSEMHPCPPKIHSSRSAVLESLDSTTRQSARVSFVPQLIHKLEKKKKKVASRSPRLGFGSQDSTFKMLRCFL